MNKSLSQAMFPAPANMAAFQKKITFYLLVYTRLCTSVLLQ